MQKNNVVADMGDVLYKTLIVHNNFPSAKYTYANENYMHSNCFNLSFFET